MAPESPLIIIGAGGHACVVAEAARQLGRSVLGHAAPKKSNDPLLGDWLGNDSDLPDLCASGARFVIGLGFVDKFGAMHRAKLMSSLPQSCLETIIHPTAIISTTAQIDNGVFVAAGAIIGTGARLSDGVLVNSGAIVDHHCQIGKNTHLATGARLSGSVIAGDDCLIGAGAVIRQGLNIGDRATVAAGAVVVSNIPNDAIWGGVPAGDISKQP